MEAKDGKLSDEMLETVVGGTHVGDCVTRINNADMPSASKNLLIKTLKASGFSAARTLAKQLAGNDRQKAAYYLSLLE